MYVVPDELVATRDFTVNGIVCTKGEPVPYEVLKLAKVDHLVSKRWLAPRPDPFRRRTSETTPTPTYLPPQVKGTPEAPPPIVTDKPIALDGVTSSGSLSVAFTASPVGWSPVSYAWDMGDGNTLTTPVPTYTHPYSAAGTYTASVVATDAAGNSGTATDTVTVPGAMMEGQNATSQAGPNPGSRTQPHRDSGPSGHFKRKR